MNVVEKTIYRLAQSGEQPVFKVAGMWRFQQADTQRWIKDGTRWPGRDLLSTST